MSGLDEDMDYSEDISTATKDGVELAKPGHFSALFSNKRTIVLNL